MGEAYVAVADEISAIHYNPAGLAQLQRQEASFMHNEFFDGVRQEWGAYAYPHALAGTFAAGYTYLGVEEFPAYTQFDEANGKVSAADMAGMLSYANQFGKSQHLAFGATAKFIESRLWTYKAKTVALDAGMIWASDAESTWRLGAALRNVGNKMKFIDESFSLPTSFHAGAAYSSILPHPVDYLNWTWAFEAAFPTDRDPYFSGGFEIGLPIELYLRMGYRQNQDSGLGISAGFGVRSLEEGFTKDWPEMQLDYAFVDFGVLDRTHRISITFRFGNNKHGEFLFKKRAEELKFY